MYSKKQINVEEYIGTKTIVMDFIPVTKGIGSRTFINNMANIYSKINTKTKCVIVDIDNDMTDRYTEEKMVNNVKVRMNKNFNNIYYVNISKIKDKAENNELLDLLVKKLNTDVVFIKNNTMEKGQLFKNLSSMKYLKKTFLLTDLDSDNALSLYKHLIQNKTKNNGTIILNSKKNDMFKNKKLENLLDIKNYSKVLCVSGYYKIIEYGKMKNQDIFKDIKSVNETEIFAEYEDNLNIILGKPTKGFAKRWVKQV